LRATWPSEGNGPVRTGLEDERDAVAVDGAAETARLLNEPSCDRGGVGEGLDVVGVKQFWLRGDEGGAADLERGFEQREGGKLRREAELQDGRREGGGGGRFADVYPWGSRREGPSMRTV